MLSSEPTQQVDRKQILQQNAEVFQDVGFTQDSAEHPLQRFFPVWVSGLNVTFKVLFGHYCVLNESFIKTKFTCPKFTHQKCAIGDFQCVQNYTNSTTAE